MKKFKDNKNKISEKKSCKELLTKKRGFTLAEVLIVIGVIGIVAAMTIPILMKNTSSKSRAAKIQNIEAKLRQGTDLMKIQGRINGFENSKEFVEELSKHMKITTICDKTNMEACWPGVNTTGITVNGEEEKVEFSNVNDAGWFQLDKKDWSDPVGFITGDGTPMIISYKKDCFVDENDKNSDGTACIAGIFDINGASAPNRYGDSNTDNPVSDIIPINTIGGIGNKSACVLDLDGTCFTSQAFRSEESSSIADCHKLQELGVDTKCWTGESWFSKDRWANSYLKCKELGGRLPNEQELQKLASYLYNISYNGGFLYDDSGIILDYSKARALGFDVAVGQRIGVWSQEPFGSTGMSARYHTYEQHLTGYHKGYARDGSFFGICVPE